MYSKIRAIAFLTLASVLAVSGRMDRGPTNLVVMATPQGDLLGVVIREEAHQLSAGEPADLLWADCDGCPGQWRAAAVPT
jgi:hypothetical protein